MCELKTAKTQLIHPWRGTQTRKGHSCVVMVMLHSGRPTSGVNPPPQKKTRLQQKCERFWRRRRPPHTRKKCGGGGEKTHSREQQSLKNRAMTLQEEEKSVIQAGLAVWQHFLSPVRADASIRRIKSPQTKQHTGKSTFLTTEPLKLARMPNQHLKSTPVVNPAPPRGVKVRKQG